MFKVDLFQQFDVLDVGRINAIFDYLESTINNLRGENFKSISPSKVKADSVSPGLICVNGGTLRGDLSVEPSVKIDGVDVSKLVSKLKRVQKVLPRTYTVKTYITKGYDYLSGARQYYKQRFRPVWLYTYWPSNYAKCWNATWYFDPSCCHGLYLTNFDSGPTRCLYIHCVPRFVEHETS